MAKQLKYINDIEQGKIVQSWHVSQSVEAFSAASGVQEAYDISVSGSFKVTGSQFIEPNSLITSINPFVLAYDEGSGQIFKMATGSINLEDNDNEVYRTGSGNSNIIPNKFGTFTNTGLSSTIAAGNRNITNQNCSFIGSGNDNLITGTGTRSTIIGGFRNTSSFGYDSFIGGGRNNKICPVLSPTGYPAYRNTILNGCLNTIDGYSCESTILSGNSNKITSNDYYFNNLIAGGSSNTITNGAGSIILGGAANSVTNQGNGAGGQTILGGARNNITTQGGTYHTIVSGCCNCITHGYAGYGSGYENVIVSGRSNIISGTSYAGSYSISPNQNIIGAGFGNKIGFIGADSNGTYGKGLRSAIIAGFKNTSSGADNFIGAGYKNYVEGFIGNSSFNRNAIVSGLNNSTSASINSFIGAGQCNQINKYDAYTPNNSFVGSGMCNTILGACNSSIVSGCCNTLSGYYTCNSIIGSGDENTLKGCQQVIGGGKCNVISSGNHSFIGGGCKNCATGNFNTVAGGQCNSAAGYYHNFVGGGCCNIVTSYNNRATIAGGSQNTLAGGGNNFIGGGSGNYSNGGNSGNLAGTNNCITMGYTGYNNSIVAGLCNRITNGYPFSTSNAGILVGRCNIIQAFADPATGYSCNSSNHSVIAGGYGNRMVCINSFIGAGVRNTSSADNSFIGAGNNNKIIDFQNSGIVSGQSNRISGSNSFIGGGVSNIITGSCHVILGGCCNKILGSTFSLMGVGTFNTGSGIRAVILAGSRNNIAGGGRLEHNTIVSGFKNEIASSGSGILQTGSYNTIVGGTCNIISGSSNFIGSGNLNFVRGRCDFIGGGQFNKTVGGMLNVIGGGSRNTGSGCHGFIGGGRNNEICKAGCLGGILGGEQNTLGNCESFIIGANLTSDKACYTFMNNLDVNGTVSASIFSGSFVGDGSGLTNVPGGGGGSTNPAGSNTQIQFNNAGSFGASTSFVFDSTGPTAKISGSLIVSQSAATGTAVTVENGHVILSQVSQSLDFVDDTAAAAGGVPKGGLYRSGNFIAIRID